MFNKSNVRRWAHRQYTATPKPFPLPVRIAIFIVMILIGAALLLSRVSAQDVTTLKCDAALMQQYQTSLDEQSKAIADAAATGDVVKWLDLLRQSRFAFSVIDSQCQGMAFNNEQDGQQPVLGPLIFADGIWKSTYTTAGYGQITFEVISGDCDQFTTMLLYNGGFTGEFKTGAQNVFTTKDICTALVKIGLADKPWSLRFELVAPAK